MLLGKLFRRLSHMKPGTEDGNSQGWRFVLHRIGFAKFSAAVILILGGVWLFLGILEDVLSGEPLVTVDRMLYRGLQGLRAPFLTT